MNSLIKNADVDIVYDPKTRRMRARARHDRRWVRFPKDLRCKAHSFTVSELRPGRKSWIACGEIFAKSLN